MADMKTIIDMNKLHHGLRVKIQRSDKSINIATVTNIAKDFVGVEWEEDGKIKGKEVRLSEIIGLNSQLFSTPMTLRNTRSVLSTREKFMASNIRLTAPLETQRFAKSSSTPRPNNTMTGIELISKNREERRQKNAQIKVEREAIQRMTKNRKYWEFETLIKSFRSTIQLRPLSAQEPAEQQITVCVRKRPMGLAEYLKKEIDIVTIPSKNEIIVHEPKTKVDLTKILDHQHFRFDCTFNETCSNDVIYNYTARPLIETAFQGGVATVFAYGQTGSGKTYTMGGEFGKGKTQNYKNGIYVKASEDIFQYLNSDKYRDDQFIVKCSFYEIYKGQVFDLLKKRTILRVLEDCTQQVQVCGLEEKRVFSSKEVLNLIKEGNEMRSSGKTSANEKSSRSHAIFQITLFSKKNNINGKFCLIDLAGNERGADIDYMDKTTKMEGADINKSLLTLKECIRALALQNNYVPFRGSKLTQVLRDAFIGDKAKTCMIATINPGFESCKHTLNTLRYADRLKEYSLDNANFDIRSEIVNNQELYRKIIPEELNEIDEAILNDENNTASKNLEEMNKMTENLINRLEQWFTEDSKWNLLEENILKQLKKRRIVTKSMLDSLKCTIKERLLILLNIDSITNEISVGLSNSLS